MIIGGLTGAIVGTYFLATFENVILKKAYGVIIVLFALNMLFQKIKLKSKNKLYGGLAGLFSGVLSAVYKTGGPPIVIYLSHQIKKKQALRATMIAFWVIINIWVLFLYLYTGLISTPVINFSLFLLPPLIIGTIVGCKLHVKINENLFKKLIGTILVVTGILLVLF